MEFLKANLLNTTTQITVNTNTLASSNLFNRDPMYQYYSDGMNDDLTTTSITITFDTTTPVSRIALVDINFKQFNVFYDGVTAQSFSILGGDTTLSSYTGNTDQNKYFSFSTIQCASITIDAKKTINANQEKVLGLLVLSDFIFSPTLTPSAKSFKPNIVPKQIVHKMSDGGTRLHNIRRKWETSISLDYVSKADRDSLFNNIYNTGLEFIFCPFGTTTSWDAQIFETIWDGPFSFYEFSDNAAVSGFSGRITLKETPV